MVPALALIVKSLVANGLSTLAGAAMAKGQEWVEEKTGLNLNEISAANDAKKLEFRQAEMKHEEVLIQAQLEGRKLDMQEVVAFLGDVQSARSRDTAIQVATGRNRRGDYLAGLAVGGFFLCLGAVFFGPEITSGERDLAMVMIGTLLGIIKDVYGFEFGSSKDSARSMQAVTEALKRSSNGTP